MKHIELHVPGYFVTDIIRAREFIRQVFEWAFDNSGNLPRNLATRCNSEYFNAGDFFISYHSVDSELHIAEYLAKQPGCMDRVLTKAAVERFLAYLCKDKAVRTDLAAALLYIVDDATDDTFLEKRLEVFGSSAARFLAQDTLTIDLDRAAAEFIEKVVSYESQRLDTQGQRNSAAISKAKSLLERNGYRVNHG